MKYTQEALEAFILNAISQSEYDRYGPKVDRLITLYLEFNKLRNWLDDSLEDIGGKAYKENITAVNALMQNIRNLEEDIGLFAPRKPEVKKNAVADRMLGNEV